MSRGGIWALFMSRNNNFFEKCRVLSNLKKDEQIKAIDFSLISKTIALRLCLKFVHISLPSSEFHGGGNYTIMKFSYFLNFQVLFFLCLVTNDVDLYFEMPFSVLS